MKLNVTFKEQNEVLKADFGEVYEIGGGDDPAVLALGKANLAEHGIVLDETATTHDVVSNIAFIPSLKYATEVTSLYKSAVFPEGTSLIIELPVPQGVHTLSVSYMFSLATNLKRVKLRCFSETMNIQFIQPFYKCFTVEEVDVSEMKAPLSSCNAAFHYCSNLKRIIGSLGGGTSYANTFAGCTSLEEVEFDKESLTVAISFSDSPLLTAESIQSIVDGLATVDSRKTLTLNAKVSSALTEEQILQITNKNWLVQ